MKYFLVLGALFFQLTTLVAQQRVLQGVVLDSLQSPLEYANVMATPKASDLPFVFGLCNNKGAFSLKLEKNTAYAVSITFMGFKPYHFSIDSLAYPKPKAIVLKAQTQMLDEIVLTEKTPLKISSDSIIYNVEEFANGHEFKLKSVMKKLPGVSIDRHGVITVMGTKVTQIFVDNKPFFEGGTKLALDNLPANVIAKIQVIKDYNEVAFMKGLSDNQKMIINIKLKEGKKHFVFGDLMAGANTDKNYAFKANAFYYAPKTNLNFIGNYNDIGDNALNPEDYRRFESSHKRDESVGVNKQTTSPLRRMLNDTDYRSKKLNFNAFQWQQDMGSKWRFNFFAVHSSIKKEEASLVSNQYLLNPIFETINTSNQQQQKLSFAKLKLNYRPSASTYYDYVLLLNNTAINTQKNTLATIAPQTNTIAYTVDDGGFNLGQDFNWYKKLNRKKILKVATSLAFKNQAPNSTWLSNQPILENLMPVLVYNTYHIDQIQETKSKRFDFLIKYYYKMNGKNHFYFTLGNAYNTHTFFNAVNQITDTANSFQGFSNDYKQQTTDFYLGFQYRFKLSKALLTPGVYWHTVSLKNTYTSINQTHNYLLPKLDLALETFGRLKLKYKMQVDQPEAHNYHYNYTIQSFNSLAKGNVTLDNALSHNLNLFYNIGNLEHNLSFAFTYKRDLQTIKNKYVFDATNSFMTPVNSTAREHNLTLSLAMEKRWNKMSLRYSPLFSWTTGYDYIVNDLVLTKSNFSFHKLELTQSLLKHDLEIAVGMNYNTINTQIPNQNMLKVVTWSPYADLYYHYKKFDFEMNYNMKRVKALGDAFSKYHFLDFKIHYGNEDKPWAISLQTTNAFAVDGIKSYEQNAYLYSKKIQFQQPRIWLLKLHYKF